MNNKDALNFAYDMRRFLDNWNASEDEAIEILRAMKTFPHAPAGANAIVEIYFDEPDRKIHCIKAIRAGTGWGLKESKDFFESATDEHNTRILDEHTFKNIAQTMKREGLVLQYRYRGPHSSGFARS